MPIDGEAHAKLCQPAIAVQEHSAIAFVEIVTLRLRQHVGRVGGAAMLLASRTPERSGGLLAIRRSGGADERARFGTEALTWCFLIRSEPIATTRLRVPRTAPDLSKAPPVGCRAKASFSYWPEDGASVVGEGSMGKLQRDGMSVGNRLKGDIAQTLVRSLLVATGYRVVDFGIEKTLRELASLSRPAYNAVLQQGFGGTGTIDQRDRGPLSDSPDFFVMDHAQTMSSLVEVKYRESIEGVSDRDLANLVRQVTRFGEVIVILMLGVGSGAASTAGSIDDHVRCLVLRHDDRRQRSALSLADSGISAARVRMQDHGGSERIFPLTGNRFRTCWMNLPPLKDVFSEL